jgi:hypothetical protein
MLWNAPSVFVPDVSRLVSPRTSPLTVSTCSPSTTIRLSTFSDGPMSSSPRCP